MTATVMKVAGLLLIAAGWVMVLRGLFVLPVSHDPELDLEAGGAFVWWVLVQEPLLQYIPTLRASLLLAAGLVGGGLLVLCLTLATRRPAVPAPTPLRVDVRRRTGGQRAERRMGGAASRAVMNRPRESSIPRMSRPLVLARRTSVLGFELRHVREACLWLARGVDPSTVQAWMGHASS